MGHDHPGNIEGSHPLTSSPDNTWRQSLTAIFTPRAITMLCLGFSAGLPLLLIFGTLSVWLREAGVERGTVTLFSWAALGYSFKFVWAPLVDRLPIPWLHGRLGRRRSWLLVAQLALMVSIVLTGSFDPQQTLVFTAVGAVLIGFSAATQDIVIDAYRIEIADASLQSMLASMYVAGYRVGMLTAGAGGLLLADQWATRPEYDFEAWASVYQVMGGAMVIGMITTLLAREPKHADATSPSAANPGENLRFLLTFLLAISALVAVFWGVREWVAAATSALQAWAFVSTGLAAFLVGILRLAGGIIAAGLVWWAAIETGVVSRKHVQLSYIAPITDFISRYGKVAMAILVLIGVYRISDIVLGAIANVFYIDIGYDKTQIATYSKFWGLWATIIGGFVGGVLSIRFGLYRILFVGAFLAAISNLLFAYLATQPPSDLALATVVIADNLSGGLASAVFVAYLSSLTNVSFTAMQYALFSSLMTLFPKLLAGYSGTFVDKLGYETFFVLTAIVGLPVLLLIWLTRRLIPSVPQ